MAYRFVDEGPSSGVMGTNELDFEDQRRPGLPQQNGTPEQAQMPQYRFVDEEKSFFDKAGDTAQHFGRRFLASAAASPKTLADFIKHGSTFLAQKGIEQKLKKGETPSEESLGITQTFLKGLGFPSEFLEKINYPDIDQMEDYIRNFYETVGGEGSQAPLTPSNKTEQGARTVGDIVGGSVLGGPRNLLSRLGWGAVGGTSAALAEAAGAGPGGQIGAAIGIPALISLAAQIKRGKFTPNTKELEKLKGFGKNMGLTEEELVLILQEPEKLQGLSKFAKLEKDVPKRFESIDTKLGRVYDELREASDVLPKASKAQVENLTSEFDSIASRLEKSVIPGEDKLKAIDKIREASSKIQENGVDLETLVNSYIDVNSAVNWKAIRGGKKELAQMKKPLQDAAKEISPAAGEQFKRVTDLYAKFKEAEKALKPKDYARVIDYGKGIALATGMAQNMARGDIKSLPYLIGGYLGADLGQKVAGKMLTDPKYQNILLKGTNAIKSGSRASNYKIYSELKDQIIKDFPEESREVDWSSLNDEQLERRKKAS